MKGKILPEKDIMKCLPGKYIFQKFTIPKNRLRGWYRCVLTGP